MANGPDNHSEDKQLDWTAEEKTAEEAGEPPAPPKLEKYDGTPAYLKDPVFFKMVIFFGGWTLILAVAIMGLLAANDKTIPEGVVAVASGLVGLLTGTFAVKVAGSS